MTKFIKVLLEHYYNIRNKRQDVVYLNTDTNTVYDLNHIVIFKTEIFTDVKNTCNLLINYHFKNNPQVTNQDKINYPSIELAKIDQKKLLIFVK